MLDDAGGMPRRRQTSRCRLRRYSSPVATEPRRVACSSIGGAAGQTTVRLATALDLLVDAQLAVGDLAPLRPLRPASPRAPVGRRPPRRRRSPLDGRVAELPARRIPGGRLPRGRGPPFNDLAVPFEAARAHFACSPHSSTAASQPRPMPAPRSTGSCRLGAARDADRVAAFLRVLGVATRPGRKGIDVLTSREQEVLACSATACPTQRSPPGCSSAARRPPTTSAAS